MYQWIFRRKIREGFEDISRGNFDKLLKQFSPTIAFSFSGGHALAGEFHQRQTVKEWFERVHRIFPGLKIEAQNIFVSGLPWNVVVVTQFRICDQLPDGTLYENKGVQVARIRWGRVVEDHLIEDTQYLAQILERLVSLGVQEAAALPLQDQAAA